MTFHLAGASIELGEAATPGSTSRLSGGFVRRGEATELSKGWSRRAAEVSWVGGGTAVELLSKEVWQLLGIDEQFNAARGPWLASDETRAFKRQHHLVNRRRADAEVFPHIGFGRGTAVQARVEVNKGQVLALLRREGCSGTAHAD